MVYHGKSGSAHNPTYCVGLLAFMQTRSCSDKEPVIKDQAIF